MSNCDYKHTKVQVPEKDYLCPKCGSTEFFIYDCVNYDCEALHEDDELLCESCGYATNGKRFASMYIKKQHLIKCPTCKGSGYIKESKQ
jgi:Zn finger protein HypA/HybF involved in hydrogenase expression